MKDPEMTTTRVRLHRLPKLSQDLRPLQSLKKMTRKDPAKEVTMRAAKFLLPHFPKTPHLQTLPHSHNKVKGKMKTNEEEGGDKSEEGGDENQEEGNEENKVEGEDEREKEADNSLNGT